MSMPSDKSSFVQLVAPPSGTTPLWRNRDYLIVWGGQSVSYLGSQISQLALPLLILAITRSPAQAGIVGMLRAIPYLFISLPAGALVDRWDRKRIMLLCDLGRTVSVASVPLALALGHLTLMQIYITALVEGSLVVFYSLAATAALPRLVSQEQLSVAMGQSQASEGLIFLIGPLIGGALYAVSQVLPFFLDAVSYAVSVVSLIFVRKPLQVKREASSSRLAREILEGLSWLLHQPLIRYLAFLGGGVNLVLSSYPLLVIVLAQHMHASSVTIGVIMAIGGSGAVLGAMVGSAIQRQFTFQQVIVGILWVWVVFWLLYAVAPNVLVLGIITAVFFMTEPIYNLVQYSYRLSVIPDELQGRVNSAFRLIAFSGQPLGLALVGILLQATSILFTVLVFFAALLVLALLTMLNPHVKIARHPAPASATESKSS